MLQQNRMTRPMWRGRPVQMIASRLFFPLVVIAPLAGLAAAAVIEAPKPQPAQKYLGAKVSGPNYTVKPTVRSDGVMRNFEADTSYGKFTFDGVEFTKLRLHELEAAAAIEKMSQSEAFGQAFGRAALGPIKFGADLLTKPADTVERSLSGIGNMLDRVGAGLSNTRADRDNVMESLLGVSDTQRQLAVDLDVDPYTDFPPLAERLKQMAGAMAGGGLPVRAGLALVPGGVGIAVSSVASVDTAKDSLRNKTAAQVIAEAKSTLASLGVPPETIDRLVENRNYTPADLLIMARALKRLGAENTVISSTRRRAPARAMWLSITAAVRRSLRRAATNSAASCRSSPWAASRSIRRETGRSSRPSRSTTLSGPISSKRRSRRQPRKFVKFARARRRCLRQPARSRRWLTPRSRSSAGKSFSSSPSGKRKGYCAKKP